MVSTYNYSILRLTLDERRGETVNIGVVVFKGNECEVHLLPTMRKVQTLDANVDTTNLYNIKTDIPEWVKGAETAGDAHQLLQKFGGVSVSELGWFTTRNDDDFGVEVKRLMSDLVAPPSKRRTRSTSGRLQTEIKKVFNKKRLMSTNKDDILAHRLIPNYPIGEELYVDFALKNGKFQVTETTDFRVVDDRIKSSKLQEVGLKCVTLDQAQFRLGEDTERFFVYAANASQERLINAHLSLVSKYSDRIFNFVSRDDKMHYLDHTLSALGDTVLGSKI